MTSDLAASTEENDKLRRRIEELELIVASHEHNATKSKLQHAIVTDHMVNGEVEERGGEPTAV